MCKCAKGNLDIDGLRFINSKNYLKIMKRESDTINKTYAEFQYKMITNNTADQ